ncbi:MAG: TIGR01777 family protein [Candidatus Omnitrophica bacterium]|nr:TIGR01777 family protein [Candidatus Omnitrophota bacterium]
MIVLVTGSRGLVGAALVPTLEAAGHTVRRLSLRGTQKKGLFSEVEGADAVVHLAGENIAARRWTPAQKAEIRDSRVIGTRVLCDALARLTAPPKTFISASAVGIYGDRGDEMLRDDSAPGAGFLAETAVAWEQAADPVRRRGLRVVHLRFGVILSRRGGALAKMLPPFRLGVGGPLGSGRQWFSWVALDDVIGVIQFALATEALRGPVNVVAPNAVTNAEFTSTLGRVLHRPVIFPAPAWALRLLLGEMVDELLLASTRAEPAALTAAGYRFRYPALEPALRALLIASRGSIAIGRSVRYT